MSANGFWLSHHHPDELDRCYRLGPVAICARCATTYPVLALTLAAQFALQAPLAHPLDVPLAVGLTLPALLDWAYGRFVPHAFSNPWRSATGALLGLALGRTLFIHLQRPLPWALLAQLGVVLAVALPVLVVRALRSAAP